MEGGDKGKYVVIVALIGALATVAVPVLNHYFPAQQNISNPPIKSDVPAGQVGAPQEPARPLPRPNAEVARKARSVPGPSTTPSSAGDVAGELALGKELIRVGKLADAINAFQNISSKQPTNPVWHSCIAELSVGVGLADTAEAEFRKAAQLGKEGMYDVAARVQVNRTLLEQVHDWHETSGVSDEDWSLLKKISTISVPGTGLFSSRICKVVHANSYGPGAMDKPASELEKWSSRQNQCFSGQYSGAPATDCR